MSNADYETFVTPTDGFIPAVPVRRYHDPMTVPGTSETAARLYRLTHRHPYPSEVPAIADRWAAEDQAEQPDYLPEILAAADADPNVAAYDAEHYAPAAQSAARLRWLTRRNGAR